LPFEVANNVPIRIQDAKGWNIGEREFFLPTSFTEKSSGFEH
jgi:hypothetical protein